MHMRNTLTVAVLPAWDTGLSGTAEPALDRSSAESPLARENSVPRGPVRLAAAAAAFWAACLLNELAEGTPGARVCRCSKSACRDKVHCHNPSSLSLVLYKSMLSINNAVRHNDDIFVHLDAKVPILEVALRGAGKVQGAHAAVLLIHEGEGQVRARRLRMPCKHIRDLTMHQLQRRQTLVRGRRHSELGSHHSMPESC